MKNMLVFAAAAVSLFAACSGKINEDNEAPSKAVDMEISVSCCATKASDQSGEANVNTLQVLVFGDNNKLEAYKRVSSSLSLKMGIFSGTKIIHAVVNAPDFTGIVDYKGFCSKVTDLADNGLGNFIMEGSKTVTVGTDDISVPIEARRIVSKVSLVKVENKLSGIHQALGFVVKSAYLINVAGNRGFKAEGQTLAAPTKWYHQMKYSADDGIFTMTYDACGDVSLDYSSAYTGEHHFYCYPNPTEDDCVEAKWKERRTRLVVEIELGGKLYYYPVTLPVLEQNTHYKVSLSVTRPGSGNPDMPYREDSANASITVIGWQNGSSIVETI